MTLHLGRRFLLAVAALLVLAGAFIGGYFTGQANPSAPAATTAAAPAATAAAARGDCFVQPNQFSGSDAVLEVTGAGALNYCAQRGANWHAANAPTFITAACVLNMGGGGGGGNATDVSPTLAATVWDTGLMVNGNDICSTLRAQGWSG